MVRFILYLIRWQLSTLILAPSVAFFKHSPNILGTKEDWIAAGISNLIGGCIFFWVDRFIFKSKMLETSWEVLPQGKCADCGAKGTLRRLVQAPGGYDKSDDPNPEYRCNDCSKKKMASLVAAKKVKNT